MVNSQLSLLVMEQLSYDNGGEVASYSSSDEDSAEKITFRAPPRAPVEDATIVRPSRAPGTSILRNRAEPTVVDTTASVSENTRANATLAHAPRTEDRIEAQEAQAGQAAKHVAAVRERLRLEKLSLDVETRLIGADKVDSVTLRRAMGFLDAKRYWAIVEERSIGGRCGLPTCAAPVDTSRQGKNEQYRVSRKLNKMLPVKELVRFCTEGHLIDSRRVMADLSETPVYLRDENQRVRTVDEALGMDKPRATDAQRDVLGVDEGFDPGRIVVRETAEPAAPSKDFRRGAGAHAIDGHVPKSHGKGKGKGKGKEAGKGKGKGKEAGKDKGKGKEEAAADGKAEGETGDKAKATADPVDERAAFASKLVSDLHRSFDGEGPFGKLNMALCDWISLDTVAFLKGEDMDPAFESYFTTGLAEPETPEVRAFIVRHIERAMGRIRPILGISLPSMSDVRRIVNTFAIARYVDVGDLREKHMDLLTGVLAHVLLAVRVDDDVMDPFYRHCLVDAAEYAALVAAFDEENFI